MKCNHLLPSHRTIPLLTLPTSKNLSQALQALHTAASPPNQLPSVPHELIEYVENGRNPDIYTREFVETVRRGNQLLKGKLHAFGSFRDVLAAEMAVAMPELRQDVDRVCEATGGKPPVVEGEGEGGAAEAGASGVAPPRPQDATAAATAPGPSAPTPTPTPAPSSGA